MTILNEIIAKSAFILFNLNYRLNHCKPGANSFNVSVTVKQKAQTHPSIYWRGQHSGWGWARAWCFYCYRDVV